MGCLKPDLASSRLDVLVEEDSGADDKLEDVLQRLHGLQQLFCQLLGIVNVVLQDFGQLPKRTHTEGPTNQLFVSFDKSLDVDFKGFSQLTYRPAWH